MRPETLHLVDLCARQRGLSAAYPVKPGLSFDWARFLDAADRHKVTGLAYRAFTGRDALSAPPEVVSQLKRQVAAKRAAKAMLLSEWRRVEEALRADGVRVLMFKGPALSLQIYGDAEAREYRDIDLLVDASALERAADIFASIGYEPADAGVELSTPKREFLQRQRRHLAFRKVGFPVYLEVHGSTNRSFCLAPIGIDAAFRRAEPLRSGDLTFPTLERGDHALLTLIHGAIHEWCQLQWILDVMALLSDSSIRLETKAKRTWDSVDPLCVLDSFLILAGRLFDTPVLGRFSPPTGLRHRRAVGLSDYTYARFAVGGARMVGLKHSLVRQVIYPSGIRRGLAGKMRVLSRIARPSIADFASFRNKRLPLFVYYLARPFLILVRMARGVSDRNESERE